MTFLCLQNWTYWNLKLISYIVKKISNIIHFVDFGNYINFFLKSYCKKHYSIIEKHTPFSTNFCWCSSLHRRIGSGSMRGTGVMAATKINHINIAQKPLGYSQRNFFWIGLDQAKTRFGKSQDRFHSRPLPHLTTRV